MAGTPVRFVVVARIPIKHEGIKAGKISVGRRFAVHYHAAWAEQAPTFAHDLSRSVMACFVNKYVANDEIKTPFFKIRMLRVLLAKMDWFTQIFCSCVGIPQHWRGYVYRMNFGFRKRVHIWER